MWEISFFLSFVLRRLYDNKKVLAANIDTTGEPRLDGKIPKSTVVQVGNRSVGIIGYLTTETSVISKYNKVEKLIRLGY